MIIAHDLGTSGDKASLHDDSGRLVDAVTVGYPTSYFGETCSEQNPDDWWEAVAQATRRLLAVTGVPAGQVQALCVSGQMMGAVLLDERYRPVRPAMIWSDQRATDQAARLCEVVDPARWYRVTGHRMAPTYPVPKLMWVRENEPDVWAATRHVCVAKDYVNYRLTGRLVIDHSDASSTDAYDLMAGAWSAELLEAAGMDESLWPSLVGSTDVIGCLRAEAADALGLGRGTAVVAGGGDGPMAGVGAGCVAPGSPGYVCLGTSAWFATSTAQPVFDPGQRSFSYRHIVPGVFNPCATTQTGAGSMQWMSDSLAGGQPVGELIDEGLAVSAADDGLFFLPYFLGERTPWWDANASGTVVGLRRHHGRAHLIRAALEGVGYSLALCIEPLRASSVGNVVDVIGGGAASDGWLQLLADIWGMTVRRRTVTSQANSLGAAVTALVGLGLADFSLAGELSHIEGEFEPGPDSARHQEHLARYADAYSALAGWYAGTTDERH